MYRSAGGFNLISQKIKIDVINEFVNIKESLQIYLLEGFSVSETRHFMKTHVPGEINYKSKVLLDTLINYLMDDAQKKIEATEVELQISFYKADFRSKIHEWVEKLENRLLLEPDIVKYTTDPCLIHGLMASGITFVVGIGISITLAPSIVGSILSSMVTILLSTIAFKVAFETAIPKARETIKLDIERYIDDSQNQILIWLSNVEECFNDYYREFCSSNGFEMEMI